MTSCRKHSKIKLLVLFLLLLLSDCSEEEKETKSIAQVNGAVLTEHDLNAAVEGYGKNNRFKEEYINNWIKTEILYSEAVDNGILNEKDFISIVEQSKKNLAVSLYLNKLLDENQFVPSNEELLKYYNDQADDFRLDTDAFSYNICEFGNFDKAVQFRSILLESDWNKAINAFRDDADLKYSADNQLKSDYLLQPQILLNAVNMLLPNEVSIVLQTGATNYTIVQLIEKYNKGDLPPYEAVKQKIKNQFVVLKQKEFIQNYVEKLVEVHNIEIKRY